MALVACTQLKKLDLRFTELTGEWFVVGIDRGPVPSEQRMERASWNTPHQNYWYLIRILFSGSVPRAARKYFSWILKNFFERFFVLILCSLCVSDKEELRSALGQQCCEMDLWVLVLSCYAWAPSNGETTPDRENHPKSIQRKFPLTHMATSSRKHQEIH